MSTICDVVDGFRAAVQEASNDTSSDVKFKVDRGAGAFNIACGLALRLLGCVFATVFNAVVRLCIADLLPAFLRHLKVKVTSNVDSRKIEKATKGKLWTQIKPSVKSYLAAFTKVILHCILPRFTCKRFKMIISRYIFRWSV